MRSQGADVCTSLQDEDDNFIQARVTHFHGD